MDNLTGKLVRLRPCRDADFEYFATLKNDLRTQAWNQRMPLCYTAAKMRDRFAERLKDPHTGIYAIETSEGQLAGLIEHHEGPVRFAATLGIILGMEHWGKGIGREAQELVLRFLFEERGLQVVRLWTTSANERMVRAAEKAGFRLSARLRGAASSGGSGWTRS